MWRVIIDANWWVSYALSNFNNDLSKLLLHSKLEVISSDELQSELFRAIEAPKLQKYLPEERKARLRAEFALFSKKIRQTSFVQICRDQKDDYLLALSKDSNASFVLTGDKDLLVLDPFGKTRIMRLPDFLEWLEKQT